MGAGGEDVADDGGRVVGVFGAAWAWGDHDEIGGECDEVGSRDGVGAADENIGRVGAALDSCGGEGVGEVVGEGVEVVDEEDAHRRIVLFRLFAHKS